MMTAARRWAHAMLHVCAATAAAVACSNDFPNAPERAVTLQAVAWPPELHVTDVDTIEIRLQLRDSPQEITGLRLRWQSSNDEVLRVVQLEPPKGGSREDTLVAQRRAVVTGRSGGLDTIRVVLEAGGGFEPADSTFVIRVTQKWKMVSAGTAHTCGVTVDSVSYCWGEGDVGQLGRGRLAGSAVPVAVVATENVRFDSVSAGDKSSCGITTIGLAYCWGLGKEGRLGNNDPSETNQLIAVRVFGPAFQAVHVGRVACGVRDDDVALCWGTNGEGQLGYNPFALQGLPNCKLQIPCSLLPVAVDTSAAPEPKRYSSVSVGGHHTCGVSALPSGGLAFCWGVGLRGALGTGTTKTSLVPLQVLSPERFTVISAGGEHTCALSSSNKTYCWGANGAGQLGIGTTVDTATPALVNKSFVSISAGGHHTCAIDTAGRAFCWGRGSSGQLGNGGIDSLVQPFPVSDSLTFKSLTAGDLHTCGITTDGSLYCWGNGAGGRLGTDSVANRMIPTRVSEPR